LTLLTSIFRDFDNYVTQTQFGIIVVEVDVPLSTESAAVEVIGNN